MVLNVRIIDSAINYETITVEFEDLDSKSCYYIVFNKTTEDLDEIGISKEKETTYKKYTWEEISLTEQRIIDSILVRFIE